MVLEHERVMREASSAARPRVWFGKDGLLFVGRADGLYRSTDLQSWNRGPDVAVTALAYLEQRDLWVAGTQDGVRFSVGALAGQAWIDAEDGTEGVMVFDLAAAEEGMYAATNTGLWFASDAQSWTQVAHSDLTILSVLPDPDWEQGLWLSTPGNIFSFG